MKKSSLTIVLAFACAAITLSLAVSAQAQRVTFVARFSGQQASPSGVTQGPDGNFYGVADGGAYSLGQVFRMTPSGELSTIYSFCSQSNCPDGEFPVAVPVLGSDGNFYGVTEAGGNLTQGGVFYRMTPGGKVTILYRFCAAFPCADGASPTGVILASDGNFYGTTQAGGAHNNGTIFQISPTGKLKVLHTFCSIPHCTDGFDSQFPPIQGRDGNFYGTTYAGGAQGGGVVYELAPSGAYTVLHHFCGQNETCEADPSTVVEDADGNLFGTTVYNRALVFEITTSHQYRVLYTLSPPEDGDTPFTGLILANDGNFYGMTQGGGTAAEGTIFEVTPEGDFTSLYSFASPKGYDPAFQPLFEASDGGLYGATDYSVFPCCYGTIFRLDNGLSPLVKTAPTAGKVGKRVLILGNGLTGTTSVTFNGVPAEFTVEKDTFIRATVPAGATTGVVSVVTPSGTLNSNPQFVVTK